ncbi:pilus assembly protein PilM [Sedimentibacter sp.]|uniref:pilus assembly protein PilM n=1 Tax=Sedimentibacter sp. TaxID=1960295 RepID=UPI0028AED62D|nr:pilus assembly protein PilM [Sedimentibacter sp.]
MGRILSVEIKNRNIKILDGLRKGSSITVYKSLLLDLEPGSIDDGKIIDIDSVVHIIDNALKENNIKTKNAIFIINTNATITRNMELPLLKSNSETFLMVKNELSQLLPVDIEQYKIVYKKTDTVTIDGVVKGLYIVYGLPIAIYEQYIELSESLKLELVAMDLASNCLDKIAAKSLFVNKENLKPSTSVGFVDIGYNNILFSVLNDGKDIFSRISSNGLRDIVNNFEAVYNLSTEEAINEIYGLSLGDNFELNKISKSNILEENINMWADEFNRYIRYYNSNNKDRQIEHIYVYGSFANMSGIDQYLESRLNISTSTVNELSNIIDKTGKLDIKTYMNTILSLYIDRRDINFLTDRKKQHKNKFNTGVVVMAASLIAVLTIAYYGYSYFVEKSALDKDIAAMEAFLNNQENIMLNDEAVKARNKSLLLQKYKDEADKLLIAIKNEDAVNSIIFEQIAASIPHGTIINSMSIDRTSINLQCTSASRQEAAQFEKNLQGIEFIDNVYIPAVADSAEGSSVSYSYSVVCDVKDVIVNEAE